MKIKLREAFPLVVWAAEALKEEIDKRWAK